MDIIYYCKMDLEKILGFPVEIFFRKKGENNFALLSNMSELEYSKLDGQPVEFQVRSSGAIPDKPIWWRSFVVSYWTLQQLPGCCGVLLSSNSYVDLNYRGKGVASRLNMFRKHIAHSQGYAVLMCTDVASNEPQDKILQKNGWKRLFQFLNWRTRHQVNISVCEIPMNPKHDLITK